MRRNVWERWVQDPYFQSFTGEEFFQHALPHERSGISHWQERIGDKLDILLAYILVLIALTFTPVVYVAPMRELSVLITVPMGTWLLGEGQMKQRLTWAAVILAGMVLLATG